MPGCPSINLLDQLCSPNIGPAATTLTNIKQALAESLVFAALAGAPCVS